MKSLAAWVRSLFTRGDGNGIDDNISITTEAAAKQGASDYDPAEDEFYQYLRSQSEASKDSRRKLRQNRLREQIFVDDIFPPLRTDKRGAR